MPVSTATLAGDQFTTFGDLLKYLRRRAGLTQRELSIAVGYSEAQISRLEQNERLPDLATLTARFLPALHAEDEPPVAARLLDLAAAVRREDAPAAGLAPYKGLLYFDEADAELFFGRESLTEALVAQLLGSLNTGDRFLAVVGASGSGKSSLLRAGLVPAVRWHSTSSGWPVVVLTPGAHPLEALASAVALEAAPGHQGARGRPVGKAAAEWPVDGHALHRALQGLAAGNGAVHALIVVDQFEELFTHCRDEAEQVAFVDGLLTAASEPAGSAVVVIGLRADFYAHCARFERLRQALGQHQAYIGPMTAEELSRAIEEPARHGQWKLEPGLTDLLLQDVGAVAGRAPEPGALPLLSHALLETWQRRRGHTLTLSGYAAAGGVGSAIAETAEAVFHDQLDEHQRAIAKQVWLRLTEVGPEAANTDTRRRVSLAELARCPEEQPLLNEVLQLLADARLITTGQDSVEVAHEALIREWPTLRGWLEEDRERLRLHHRLTEAAQDWAASGRDAGGLYRGARLAQVLEWAASPQPGPDLNALEQEFLRASQALAEQETAERQAQQQREVAAAQALAEAERQRAAANEERAEEQSRNATRLRHRAMYLVLALGIALVLLAATLWLTQVSNQATAKANQQAALAQARELGAAAELQVSTDPQLSLLLALQAISVTRSAGLGTPWDVQQTLHDVMPAQRMRWRLKVPYAAQTVAYSADGKRITIDGGTSDTDRTYVIDAATQQTLQVFPGIGFAYSPDEKLLATGSDPWGQGGVVRLWDAVTGRQVLTLTGSSQQPYTGFALYGDTLIAGHDWADVWDLHAWRAAGAPPGVTLTPTAMSLSCYSVPGYYGGITFSPDGQRIAALCQTDNTVSVSAMPSGKQLFSLVSPSGTFDDVAFSPDGQRLATANDGGMAQIWDAATGSEILRLNPGHGEVWHVAFSPDGKQLADSGEGGRVTLWDTTTGDRLLELPNSQALWNVAFSPDGNRLVAAMDGLIQEWDITPEGPRELNLGTYSPAADSNSRHDASRFKAQIYTTLPCINSMKFSPDGSWLAAAGSALHGDGTCGGGGQVYIWDVAGDKLADTPSRELTFDPTWLNQIDFSPDGKRLAGAGYASGAVVWDLATGQAIVTLTGHSAAVNDIRFSPDGKYLVTASADQTVKVWDAQTGAELLNYPISGIGAFQASFTSGDEAVLIESHVSGDRSYERLDAFLDFDALVAEARRRLQRDWQPAECVKYLHTQTCPGK